MRVIKSDRKRNETAQTSIMNNENIKYISNMRKRTIQLELHTTNQQRTRLRNKEE
jgi:hypothetical protein